jgi:Tol biopolymer transport system component
MMGKRWVEGQLLAWSSNGRYLAMQGPGTRDGHNAIVLVDTATGRAWRLTDWYNGDPTSAAFSPDNKWLAFAQGTTKTYLAPPRTDVEAHVGIVSLDGSQEFDVPGTGNSVTWDNDVVLYSGCFGDPYNMCAVDARGTGVRTVNMRMRNPTMSPDGNWLAGGVETDAAGRTGDALGIAHPDGTGAHTIDDKNALLGRPSWTPDSQTIVYATTTWDCSTPVGSSTPPPVCPTSNVGLMSAALGDFSVKVLTTHGERSPLVGRR